MRMTKKRREEEAAVAAAELAPKKGPTRAQSLATIRTLLANAGRFDDWGMEVSADRCRAKAQEIRDRLA